MYFEFRDKAERALAETEKLEQETDKIEEQKEREALEWAEQEEARELAELEMQETNNLSPENAEWMEKELAKGKVEFGTEFGENINEDFS